jgi:hypothetical protein
VNLPTGRDLNRADAVQATQDAYRAVGVLNHLAIAGVLHIDDADYCTQLTLLTKMDEVLRGCIECLSEAALQLPEAMDE